MPTSRTEQLARELIVGRLPFLEARYNQRPDWLRNPKTSHKLELDIWFPQIHLAVEAQGIGHARPIADFHPDTAAFIDQQGRDAHKAEACKERGIELIAVTVFDLTEARFPAHLRRIFQLADRATMDNPALADKVRQARLRFERGGDRAMLLRLYREAESLSRMQFRPAHQKTSWWGCVYAFIGRRLSFIKRRRPTRRNSSTVGN